MKQMKQRFLIITLAVTAMAATTSIGDWELFRFDRGLFQIEMPDLPAFSSQELSTNIGNLTMSVFMHEGEEGVDENLFYMISFTVYPADKVNAESMSKAALDEHYKNSLQSTVNNMDGVLIEEKEIELFGHEGRDIKISYFEGQMIMRMQTLLVKNRMYALQTVASAGNDNNDSQRRFFNSFELLSE